MRIKNLVKLLEELEELKKDLAYWKSQVFNAPIYKPLSPSYIKGMITKRENQIKKIEEMDVRR